MSELYNDGHKIRLYCYNCYSYSTILSTDLIRSCPLCDKLNIIYDRYVICDGEFLSFNCPHITDFLFKDSDKFEKINDYLLERVESLDIVKLLYNAKIRKIIKFNNILNYENGGCTIYIMNGDNRLYFNDFLVA